MVQLWRVCRYVRKQWYTLHVGRQSAQQVTVIAPVTFAMLETPVLGCSLSSVIVTALMNTQDAANPYITYCQLNAKNAANPSVPEYRKFCRYSLLPAEYAVCIIYISAYISGFEYLSFICYVFYSNTFFVERILHIRKEQFFLKDY